MAGAYTAKPEDVVSSDVPPGWNPAWPHPGPFPPGYEPELLLSLAAPATIFYTTGLVGGVTTSLTDQVTYRTAEPGDQLLWTATLLSDGLAVGLKLSGGEGFSNVLLMDYAEISELWGSLSDIVFDISESDGGDTIRLQVSSTPFDGFPVSASADIVVNVAAPPVVLRVVYTMEAPSESFPQMQIFAAKYPGVLTSPFDEDDIYGQYDSGLFGWSAFRGGFLWNNESRGEDFSASQVDTLKGQVLVALQYDSYYGFNVWKDDDGVAITFKLQVYANDVLAETFTKVISANTYSDGWIVLYIDADGDYTVTEQ